MLCKNCFHDAELHDPDEGFCRARIYHNELAIQNASVPEHCDCLAYEPDQDQAEKYRRIEAIQTLLNIERQSLAEQGRNWSQRSRKLEERLRQTLRSTEYFTIEEGEEESTEDQIEETNENISSTTTGGVSRFTREGMKAEPSYDELKARLAELEKQDAARRSGELDFKIGQSGGVSVYGLGRFPTTLYYDQWIRLLEAGQRLRAFLEEQKVQGKLKLRKK